MKRSNIKQVSAKRRTANIERKKAIGHLYGGPCEIGPVLTEKVLGWRCGGVATDGHEVKTRARGGSITDRANIIMGCRTCHSWVTEHPREAHDLGLVKNSWE